jgi:endonuclease-3
MICLPVGPRCDSCDLSSAGLCPSAKKGSSKKQKTVLKASSGPEIEIALEAKEESPRPPESSTLGTEQEES